MRQTSLAHEMGALKTYLDAMPMTKLANMTAKATTVTDSAKRFQIATIAAISVSGAGLVDPIQQARRPSLGEVGLEERIKHMVAERLDVRRGDGVAVGFKECFAVGLGSNHTVVVALLGG